MQKTSFTVHIKDNGSLTSERPLRGQEVLLACGKDGESNIVAWRVNNYLRSLDWTVDDDCFVEFVDTSSFEGMEVYRRSLSFLLVLASKRALSEDVFIRHSISDGYYCELESGSVSEDKVWAIKEELKRLVASDIPLKRE
ncbi:MAG: nucleoside kinase, partial [Acetomicrobium flavidum]|nr:nucleoside kinase [Acetomicrobium flavidum]